MILTYISVVVVGLVLLGIFEKDLTQDEFGLYICLLLLWPVVFFAIVCAAIAIAPFSFVIWIGNVIRTLIDKRK
jgi:hypothetical protein